MSLRVALVIDGDASGAKKAADETTRALGDVGQKGLAGLRSESERASTTVQAGLGKIGKSAGATVIPLDQARVATGALANAHGGLSTQAMALGHSMRSAVEGIALGVSPTQILAQQLNHLFYAASGQGGVSGALGEVTTQLKSGISWLGRLLTPARLATGVMLGIGIAAVTAASQWGEGQRQIELGLSGIGRASGLASADINRIASESSSAFGLSTSEARSFATALAATGKIGKDNIEPIVKLGHDAAVAFGTDAAGAAKLFAKAFADPVKGAVELNDRYGFLDAAMLRQISNLQQQNRLYEAQAVLQAGVARGLDGIDQNVATSTKFWTAIGNAISNAWGAFGRGAARLTGIGFTEGLDEQIARVKDNIAALQKQIANSPNATSTWRLLNENQLARERAELERLTGAWQKYWDSVSGAQQRRDSFAQSAALDKTLPDLNRLSGLNNDYQLLALTLAAVNRTGGAASPILEAMGRSYEQLAKGVAVAKGEVDAFKSSSDKALAGLQLQIDAVGKRSPAALGAIAYQQTLLNLGSTSPDAVKQGDLSRTLAIRQAQQQITDSERAQLLTAQQRVDSAGLELSIIGRGSVEQERQRALLQAKQQLEQDALRTYGDRDAYDQKHLAALEQQINREASLKQLLAEQQAIRDIVFERSQIGRSSDEQQVASRLRGLYGDNYQSYTNGDVAQGMRLNQQLSFLHDNSLGVLKDFNNALRQGESLGKAFGDAVSNALGKVEDKLLEMVFNDIWNQAFGGKGGFSLWSILGLGGSGGQNAGAGASAAEGGLWYDEGGYTGTIGRKKIAGVVHGEEFVINAPQTAKHRPLLEAINAGRFPGYAGGGYVGPPMAPGYAGGNSAAAGWGSDVRVYPPASVQTTVEKSRGPNGREQVDIRQVMRTAVVETAASGDLDAVNRARYGTRRQLVNRP